MDASEEREPAQPLTLSRLLWRGATRRCPLCGQGGLFRRWVDMQPRCPRCNFSLDRVEGHWMGSMGLNIIVTFAALLLTLVIGIALTQPRIPAVPLIAAGAVVSIVVPVVFFPVSRTLWSAIDLAMRPLEPDDDVDPRWIPPPQRG